MAFGVDLTTPTSYSYGTDYSGYFDSPLYEIGVEENQWKPKSIEFHLGRPLRTGEGIRFAYRTDLAASFTTIKTLAFADNGVGAITSKTFTTEKPFNVKPGDQIQFRVSLLGTSTTTPEFKFLIVQ